MLHFPCAGDSIPSQASWVDQWLKKKNKKQKKNPACAIQRSSPGLGISSEGGNGNAFQYSCLGNLMNKGAWWLQSMVKKELGTA